MIDKMLEHFMNMLGSPSGNVEPFVTGLAALIAFVATMAGVGNLLSFSLGGAKRAFVVLALSLVIVIPITAAVSIYVCPSMKNELIRTWLPVGVAAVLGLAVTVPLMMFVMKAKYPNGVLCLVLSVGASAVVILLTQAAFRATVSSDKEMNKARDHRKEIESLTE